MRGAGLGEVPRLAGAALARPLLGLPHWMEDLSPYQHVPALPADHLVAGPLLVLTALAAAHVAVGLAGYRRRDAA